MELLAPLDWIDPLDGNTWDDAVLRHDGHTIFHRSAWARVLHESYGHRPFYGIDPAGDLLIPIMEVSSRITGKRGVSLPFSDAAGPLISNPLYTQAAYQQMAELGKSRDWKWLETRADSFPPAGASPCATYETHELDLRPGIQVLEQNLVPAFRRALRKSGKGELKISRESGAGAMRAFYKLHGRTRRRHGLPPQPERFFQAIGRNLLDSGLGFIIFARKAGQVIAGAVFLRSANRAIYKFGASDPEYWSLRPNQPVMWEAIRHLATDGCDFLNFGRTATSDAGLKRFKLSWGSHARPLHYFRYQRGSWDSPFRESKESHPLIFSHLPLPLNELAGRLIYPHLD